MVSQSPTLNFLQDLVSDPAIVPEYYAAWRPLVVDAFQFFLANLPPQRASDLLKAQTALPPDADAPTRLVHLMHDCPTLHKLGQVIARNRQLDRDFCRRLQQLESAEPRTPWEQIEPVLRKELAPYLAEYSIAIEAPALAEASVSVVVPCTWRDPCDGSSHRGVLKVLKPGVTEKLAEELEILGRVADFLDRRRASLGFPAFEYRGTFDTVRELLECEVRFDLEQANLTRAGQRFAGRADVIVPELLPFSTARITAMSRIDGVKVTDWNGDGPSRRRLAESVIRALLAVPMLSLEESAEFHADPHAGNLFATTDGRLAILDWSLTGSLGRSPRSAIARMALGAAMFDAGKITAELMGLCENAPDEAGLRRVVERALDRAALVMAPGPTWLMHLMDEAAKLGARFSANLMLFRKTLFTLEGVVEDISADVRIDDVVLREMGAAFAAELSQRGFAPPECREFGTHLSNLDLAAAMWASPQAAVNRWARVWRACWS